MKLGHIELFVKDPLKSRDFYLSIGFKLIEVQNDRYVWLDAGPIHILLRPGSERKGTESYADGPMGLVIYTDDLDATIAALTKQGVAFRGTDGPERCLTFTDPDGHWFQLVDPNNH